MGRMTNEEKHKRLTEKQRRQKLTPDEREWLRAHDLHLGGNKPPRVKRRNKNPVKGITRLLEDNTPPPVSISVEEAIGMSAGQDTEGFASSEPYRTENNKPKSDFQAPPPVVLEPMWEEARQETSAQSSTESSSSSGASSDNSHHSSPPNPGPEIDVGEFVGEGWGMILSTWSDHLVKHGRIGLSKQIVDLNKVSARFLANKHLASANITTDDVAAGVTIGTTCFMGWQEWGIVKEKKKAAQQRTVIDVKEPARGGGSDGRTDTTGKNGVPKYTPIAPTIANEGPEWSAPTVPG